MTAAVPYKDMEKTIQVVLKNFPEAPCLPVMTRSIRWALEGIPCLVFDRQRREVFLDPSAGKEGELLEFYDSYEAGDLDYFAFTRENAPWFHALIETLEESRPDELRWVHFENLGPILMADVIKQPDGKSSFQDETLRDILIKATNMKSKWLIKKIRDSVPGIEVITGHAETTLVNFTSAGGTGSKEEIVAAINSGFEGLDCVKWVHCCANIDWSLLTDSDIDVINFDAFQHSDRLALYYKEIKAFLDRGGMLAWGIVPVINEVFLKESVDSLVKRLEEGISLFVEQGIDEELLAASSWVVPSCETVMMTPELSDRALSTTREISRIMRKKYRFD
jgi:hypothetical protein